MSDLSVFKCRRCEAVFSLPCDGARENLQWAIENRALLTIHECSPGALGIGELLGALEEPMTTAAFARELEAK